MTGNKISIEIPEEVLQAAKEKLQELNAMLKPYLQGVTNEQRISMRKMGDKTLPFVVNSVMYAEANPGLIPNFVDLNEWKKDIEGYKQLTALLNLTDQIKTNLDDSAMLCGSDAYTTALSFYNSIKQAVKMNVPGTKPIYENLQYRFQKRSVKKEIEEV